MNTKGVELWMEEFLQHYQLKYSNLQVEFI